MDVRQVFDLAAPVVSAVTTPMIGVLGVLLGARFQAGRDDARWKREADRERFRWEREDRKKWLDDKKVLYSEVMVAASAAMDASARIYDPHPSHAAHLNNLSEDELAELVENARIAVSDLRSRTRNLALIGDLEVERAAWSLQSDLVMTGFYGQRDERSEQFCYLSDARTGAERLRALIRADLGADVLDRRDNDDEELGTRMS